MAEIVNLNKARKQKAREAKKAKAAENRVRFGRTKSEKETQAAQRDLKKHGLDGRLLDNRDGAPDREP